MLLNLLRSTSGSTAHLNADKHCAREHLNLQEPVGPRPTAAKHSRKMSNSSSQNALHDSSVERHSQINNSSATTLPKRRASLNTHLSKFA
jgi:hypothetical protein